MKQSMFAIAASVLLLVACGDDDDDNDITTLADGGAVTDDDSNDDDNDSDNDGDHDGDNDGNGGGAARVIARDDIVSNRSGAEQTDPQLLNAWGLAFNPDGIAWVSANGSGVSEVYDEQGRHVIDPVVIPGPSGSTEPSAPTGQVFNQDEGAFGGDRFIFVTEDGVIAGWQPDDGSEAVVRADRSQDGAIYKGVTIVRDANGDPRLFAADFHNRRVDVLDASYQPLTTADDFEDPRIPDDFAPFNVEEIDGSLLVTYAKQDADAEDDVAGVGNGYVNVFDVDGGLMSRVIAQGTLNSPWGVAVAPQDFAAAPGRLLIGNFGDGLIQVYTMTTTSSGELRADPEGVLRDRNGDDLAIDGLWALKFGPGAGGFDSNDLYFTAGPNDEADGVFGELESESDD